MLGFLAGFVTGTVTCYLLYKPVRSHQIWIELTQLKYVFFNIKKHATQKTSYRQAESGCQTQPQESACQMETDVTPSSSCSDAGPSETQETVLSWTAELFEPIVQ